MHKARLVSPHVTLHSIDFEEHLATTDPELHRQVQQAKEKFAAANDGVRLVIANCFAESSRNAHTHPTDFANGLIADLAKAGYEIVFKQKETTSP